MPESRRQLKDWIASNMTVEMTFELDRWKERASELFSLGQNGVVLPKGHLKSLDAKENVLLQLLGRAYAEAGGIVDSGSLSNSQLAEVVAIPPGTLRRVLVELLSEHYLVSEVRGEQWLAPSRTGQVVERLEKRAKEPR